MGIHSIVESLFTKIRSLVHLRFLGGPTERTSTTSLNTLISENGPLNHDPIVNRVLKRILERQQLGEETYGKRMDRDDKDVDFWAREAVDELIDCLLYIEAWRYRYETSRTSSTNTGPNQSKR